MGLHKALRVFSQTATSSDYKILKEFLEFALSWLRIGIDFRTLVNQKYDQERFKKSLLTKEVVEALEKRVSKLSLKRQNRIVNTVYDKMFSL